MTKQTTKQKHDKQRALKKKHQHETEQMAEHAARKRRAHVEEVIAIIVLLTFVPLMVFGAVFWPGSGVDLENGTYRATYLSSKPATTTAMAQAELDVSGESVMVYEDDLTGSAAARSAGFFQGRKGEPVMITVNNGLITQWSGVTI